MADASYYGLLRRGPYIPTSGQSDAGVYDEHGMTAELGGPELSVTTEVGWDYATSDHVKIVVTDNLSGRNLVLFEGTTEDFRNLLDARMAVAR